MAPVLNFLRPSNYVLARRVVERLLDFYLVGRNSLVSLASFRSQTRLSKFSPQNQAFLRDLLRRFPWWITGHLELGFIELKLGELSPERASSARSISGAKLAAEAARKLLGPTHLVNKGRNLKLQLRARVLSGFVLSHTRRFQESLDVLKSVLALNNSMLIPKELLFEVLDSAANSAYLTGDKNLALEYFRRLPEDKLSRESQLIMQQLTSET